MKHKDDRAEKALEEAYEEIKKLQEFQLDVSIILGTTRKPMLEEIREQKHSRKVICGYNAGKRRLSLWAIIRNLF